MQAVLNGEKEEVVYFSAAAQQTPIILDKISNFAINLYMILKEILKIT